MQQSMVMSAGDGPHPILILHDDGSVSRIEITVPHQGGVQLRLKISPSQPLDLEGVPDGQADSAPE